MFAPCLVTLLSLLCIGAARAEHLCAANTTFQQVASNSSSLKGRRVIVTGGDGGLGYPISLELASRGATVVIASRNLSKSLVVAQQISAASGNPAVSAVQLDLGSFRSVRAAAAELGTMPIDILVNNAGIAGNPQSPSEDGFELLFQVNYLGPFLLTHLLLPQLRAARGRVVSVASSEQAIACQAAGWREQCLSDLSLLPPAIVPTRNVTIRYQDGMPDEVRPIEVYGVTKSLVIQHAAELGRREPDIRAYSLTPGWVNTSIIKVVDLNSTVGRRKCAQQSACPCPFSPEQGSAVVAVCALADPGPSGSYVSRPDGCQSEAFSSHGFSASMGALLYNKSLHWSGEGSDSGLII